MTTSTNNKTITSHKNLSLITLVEGQSRAALALSLLLNVDYDAVVVEMTESGALEAGKPENIENIKKFAESKGFIPLVAGEHVEHERDKHQLNLNEFIYRHPKGRFFLLLANGSPTTRYAVAVIDGKAYDTEYRTRAKVDYVARTTDTKVGESDCRCEDMAYLGKCWRQNVRPVAANRPSAIRAKAAADALKAQKASEQPKSPENSQSTASEAGQVVNAAEGEVTEVSGVTEIEGMDVRADEAAPETEEISTLLAEETPTVTEEFAAEVNEPVIEALPEATDAPSLEEPVDVILEREFERGQELGTFQPDAEIAETQEISADEVGQVPAELLVEGDTRVELDAPTGHRGGKGKNKRNKR